MKLPLKYLDAAKGDDTGGAAVEFALVVPALFLVLIGGFYLALMLFASSSMQYAVEAGARCAAISTTTCGDATATQNYARGKFLASSVGTPVFTANLAAACGHFVSANMTYSFNVGVTRLSVPLASTACYP